MDLKLCEFEA